ncbi:MAG: molecular chaperone TorD family protein [Anaerolineales bacterium]
MIAPQSGLEATLVARAILYRFLALAFQEPGEALMNSLTSNLRQELMAAANHLDLATETNELSQTVGKLLASIPSAGWLVSDMRVEYTRLFVGPGMMPCPPYESVFDQNRPEADRGTVQGPCAKSMEDNLSAEGLVIDLGRVELADHVAIELEWMAYLLAQAVKTSPDSNMGQVSRADAFLNDHLATWLPEFGQKVVDNAKHPFFASLGEVLKAFIASEVAFAKLNLLEEEVPV